MPKWYQPSQSKEIRPIPWLAPKVIDRLEEIIKPHFRIIEHGCGGSTLWFSERATSVLAFDKKKEWCDIVNSKLNLNTARVFVGLDEIKPKRRLGSFDLLLIDGEPLQDRAMWLNAAPELVKPGGWVVLDNANRPDFAEERKALQAKAEHFETFDGNEPGTIYLVTELYRLK